MANIAFSLVSIIAFLVTLFMGVYIILQASKLILGRRQTHTGEHFTHGKPTPAQGTPVEAKIFGFQFKGGRIFGVFGLGVAMLLVPLKFSLDVLAAPSQGPGRHVVPIPEESSIIDSVLEDEPVYAGFHFLKDIRLIDLRSRVPIPENKLEDRYSPVTWTRYSLLEKSLDAPDTLQFEFGTTGLDLTPRSLTHEYSLVRASAPHVHGSDTLRHTYRVMTNVADEPPNQPFLVVTEVTYWNGFRNDSTDWAGMRAQAGTDEVGMILLFPDEKPMKTYGLEICPPGPACSVFRGEHVLIPSANKKILVFKVPHPRANHTYRVRWTW